MKQPTIIPMTATTATTPPTTPPMTIIVAELSKGVSGDRMKD